jgi:hypothetical protein
MNREFDEINDAFDEHASEGVGLCLTGVGPEGNIMFNEDPNFGHIEVTEEEFIEDRTCLVTARTSTVDMDALVAGCGGRQAIPPFAVTIGPADILKSKRIEAIFFAGNVAAYSIEGNTFQKTHNEIPRISVENEKGP